MEKPQKPEKKYIAVPATLPTGISYLSLDEFMECLRKSLEDQWGFALNREHSEGDVFIGVFPAEHGQKILLKYADLVKYEAEMEIYLDEYEQWKANDLRFRKLEKAEERLEKAKREYNAVLASLKDEEEAEAKAAATAPVDKKKCIMDWAKQEVSEALSQVCPDVHYRYSRKWVKNHLVWKPSIDYPCYYAYTLLHWGDQDPDILTLSAADTALVHGIAIEPREQFRRARTTCLRNDLWYATVEMTKAICGEWERGETTYLDWDNPNPLSERWSVSALARLEYGGAHAHH